MTKNIKLTNDIRNDFISWADRRGDLKHKWFTYENDFKLSVIPKNTVLKINKIWMVLFIKKYNWYQLKPFMRLTFRHPKKWEMIYLLLNEDFEAREV